MKRTFFKLIAVVLAIVIMSSAAMNVYAAPSRNRGEVKYLSEVILLEAKDLAQAKEMVEQLKAQGVTYEGVIDLNLNEGGETGVFIAYKSSTNVDDAITDLAVMNMCGDYSIGGYEQLFEQTMDRYIGIVKDYRVMAQEFKKNYDAGDVNAITAHRQMNYYYLEKDNVKIYMGDYMLNFPETNEEFAEILFGGNLKVIANIRCLLAMAAGTDELLSTRIKQAYVEDQNNPGVHNKAEYDAAARTLRLRLMDMKKSINNLPGEIEAIKKDTDLSEEERKLLLDMQEVILEREKAFYQLLTTITIGDTNLGALVMTSPSITVEQLCPVIAAATQAERLLIEYDSFYDLLLYEELSMVGEELDNALKELEKDYTPISVYYGVQNDLLEGTVGVTGAADLFSGSTSSSYIGMDPTGELVKNTIGLAVVGVAGMASIFAGSAYLWAAKELANANQAAMQQALTNAMLDATKTLNKYTELLNVSKAVVADYMKPGKEFIAAPFVKKVELYSAKVASAEVELAKASAAAGTSVKSSLKASQIFTGVFTIVIGVVCMALSIYGLVDIYSRYNPVYTDIPDNMVDVVKNETHGDRFINYKLVKSYFYDDDELVTRENDLNAYDGIQWVSLYYTKNYEAGPCLTTTADLIAEETTRSGHSPIHLFGRETNYNLNSFCGRENASEVYLAFEYSANKKSAETDIPDIIGTMFNAGYIAISAVCGLGLGFAGGLFVAHKRKKNNVDVTAG